MVPIQDILAGATAGFTTQLGRCARCIRAAFVVACAAWGLTLLAAITFRPAIAIAAGVVATSLSLLWLAHIVARSSHGTVRSVLRSYGATPAEATAIVAAFDRVLAPCGRDSKSLLEGETLRVEFVDRVPRSGQRPARVMIVGNAGIVAAVALAPDGSYAGLDPHAVVLETT
jgi:hypothetical protein